MNIKLKINGIILFDTQVTHKSKNFTLNHAFYRSHIL